jgi:hypothetical protein
LARIDHPQIDSIWIAEDTARDFACEVDVEAFQLSRSGITRAERISVLVDADDEPSTRGDRRHRRTGRHRTR